MDALPSGDSAPFRRALFIAPHLDDAVLGCGRLIDSLPGSTVLTVFAGRPPIGQDLTEWDAAAGFKPGDDIIGQRREEDRHALAVLAAHPRWLDFTDAQYGKISTPAEVAEALAAACREMAPDAVFFPLGLFHADHRLTRQAVLRVMPEFPACRWFVYADALYRTLPGEVDDALAVMRAEGLAPRPSRFGELADAPVRKRHAIERYASQLRALSTPGRLGLGSLDDAEAYWQLTPAQGVGP